MQWSLRHRLAQSGDDVQVQCWHNEEVNGSNTGSWQVIDIAGGPDPELTDYDPGLYRLIGDGVPDTEIPVGRVYSTRDDALADMGTAFGEHASGYDLDGIFDEAYTWTDAQGGGFVQVVTDEHYWVIAERHART